MRHLTHETVMETIRKNFPSEFYTKKVFGVPRGGYYIAQCIQTLGLAEQVGDPAQADLIVDDIIDSGNTARKYIEQGYKFWVPFVNDVNEWVVFPWEVSAEVDQEDIITRYIQAIGDDPNREGLLETPRRVVKSWRELYSGYTKDPKDILGKVFASDTDTMVICKDIEFFSTCEHHMIPFHGKVHIGYIPSGHVVGLSKLARLVEIYARRLQIQENMTDQIAKAIMEHVPGCKGVMVVVNARHLCMCARGVGKQHSSMTTSSIQGMFKEQVVRAEFLSLVS